MIVILKNYGKTCLCVAKNDTGAEYFVGTKHFAISVANALKVEWLDISEEVEEQKLLEHNKVLIVKS